AQRVARAVEREILPRNVVGREHAGLDRLVARRQLAADDVRGVDDDDVRRAGVGVDADDRTEPDIEARFFFGLANGGVGDAFAAVDIAAGEDPLAKRRLDAAPQKNHTAVDGTYRPCYDFRIEIKNKRAVAADKTRGLAAFNDAGVEAAAAFRTKAILRRSMRMRVAVMVLFAV